jgi:hypothetical protein
LYRYDSEDDLENPLEGPVRQSQGADLAEWLDQFPPQDPLFHARQRVNLHEEVGLPPAQLDTFQGLSFDLKGLAECLSRLPLHEVLKVPPPVDENGNKVIDVEEKEISRIEEDIGDNLPSNDDVRLRTSVQLLEKVVVKQQAPLPPPSTTAATTIEEPSTSVKIRDTLHKMNINASVDDVDDELDALLGLGVTAAVPKHSGATFITPQGNKPEDKEDSLEAWLDNL